MKKMNRKKSSGFTLIELMVVITIIGILGAMIFPMVVGRDDSARVDAAKSDLRSISNALDMYKLDNFSYPTTDQGLDALVNKPADAKNWAKGGYLPKKPVDPWGNDYVYLDLGDGSYEVFTYGKDGQEGGEEFAADISSAEL